MGNKFDETMERIGLAGLKTTDIEYSTAEKLYCKRIKAGVVFNPYASNPYEPCTLSAPPLSSSEYKVTGMVWGTSALVGKDSRLGYVPLDEKEAKPLEKKEEKPAKPRAAKMRKFIHAWKVFLEILDHGVTKHEDDSWEKYTSAEVLDKFYRHVLIYGEKDPESGKDSLAHALWNLVVYFELKGRGR